MRHVGQISLPRLQTRNHIQRLAQTEMGRMRAVAQGIQDQNIEVLQQAPALLRDTIDVGAVGDIADAKTEHVEMGVNQGNRRDPLPKNLKRFFGDPLKGELRHISQRALLGIWTKSVSESVADKAFHLCGAK